ncbi:hypothetical protein Pan258_17930 [Symmachiella dynata]|uniref:hypothetical protein n=1 Tax=Symmachiella dynata TaxID=2527995 RepID=UPI0011897139|nr:hypothetical protein [Symmachiella dynata]QDT47757.1 hypothetical protein Pan258_17930 [Symmachiella dynata]
MNRSPSETDPAPRSATPLRPTARWQSIWGGTVLFTVALSVMFVLLSHVPLWHTDLWGHLQYGEILCTEKTIPATEPIMPLAANVPFVDSAWLSQVIAYLVFEFAGLAGLQCLYAACITACCALLLWISRRHGRGLIISLAAAAVWLALEWQQLPVIRPQLAGAVCFLALLACLSRRHYGESMYAIVTGLMLLWTNLHGSFIMGLGLLSCFTLGRAIDVVRRSKRLTAIAHDTKTRQLLVLTLCGGLAVFVNPYGPQLYIHVLTFARNPNLSDLTEWKLLSVTSQQGQIFAAAVIVLIPMLYFSPRRTTAAEILLLSGLGAATVWTSRMIVWFAPIAAYVFVLHGGALWNRYLRSPRPRPLRTVRQYWARATFVVVAIVIAGTFSPLGHPIWSGRPVNFSAAVSSQTPVAAAEFLLERQPSGQIFNTYEWGDYLSWVGRQHAQRWPIFVASHAHLVPRQVWVDYMTLISAPADWEQRLEQYDVQTVVIDKRYRSALIARLRTSNHWTLVFEDEIATIFIRNPT